MWNFLALALLALVSLTHASPVERQGLKLFRRGFDYENDLVRGVNLGGWLVLEPYITPSLFDAFGTDESQIPVDEYHYTQTLGKEEAFKRLNNHWDTFYSSHDIANIAARGLNLLRIPVGYWAFVLLDDDPYVQGQVKYLDRVIQWARDYELKVWIDLHGAPGSQNGFDNSGLRDQVQYQTDKNTEMTLTALQKIFDKYGADEYLDVIVGIELLNEPSGTSDFGRLNDLWKWAYKNLRGTGSVQNVVIQDAFTGPNYFDDKFLLDEYWGVVIDHHHYQVFSNGELARTIDEHVKVACSWGDQAVSEYHWNVCGEWSAALTDCSRWLNGVGRGARWDKTFQSDTWFGSCEGMQDADSLSDEQRENIRRYIEAQLDAYERRGGWIFWCWKTESSLDWDMEELFEKDLFPWPLSDRRYPGQCS